MINIRNISSPLLRNLPFEVEEFVVIPALESSLLLGFGIENTFFIAQLNDLALISRDAAVKGKLVAIKNAAEQAAVVSACCRSHIGRTDRETADDLLGCAAPANLFLKVCERLSKEEWRDDRQVEVVEPIALVQTQGLERGLIEDKDWPRWHVL